MKIINNNECYVQKNDLDYLIYSDPSILRELSLETISIVINQKSPDNYIKIDDSLLKEYIMSSNEILDFSEYYGKNMSDLELMVLKLKIAISDLDYTYEEKTSLEENNNKVSNYDLDRMKKEYMLHQIKEIIAYKKKKSKIEYPNIPNTSLKPIETEEYGAIPSMDYSKVLIYDLNGLPISDDADKEFCKIAYQMFNEDDKSEEEVYCKLTTDGKYISVSKNMTREKKLLKKL